MRNSARNHSPDTVKPSGEAVAPLAATDPFGDRSPGRGPAASSIARDEDASATMPSTESRTIVDFASEIFAANVLAEMPSLAKKLTAAQLADVWRKAALACVAAQPSSCSRYAWCATCRTFPCDDGETYVVHGSHPLYAPVPPGLTVEHGELLSAEVGADESLVEDQPTLYIGHAGDGTFMDTTAARVWLAGMRAALDGIEFMADQVDASTESGVRA
ncbi:hypothetical protein ACFQ61_04935 [Streptomyces sp. NPDC056500]|uniref:hypothetical protein n=1 Tax=Streptomyces sp. NPDC056500 TaxID=3345840 RepID=UPI0036B6E16C